MDIRSYFSSVPKKTTSTSSVTSEQPGLRVSPRKCNRKRVIIDSDSDEDTTYSDSILEKPSSKSIIRKKRSFDSSDEDINDKSRKSIISTRDKQSVRKERKRFENSDSLEDAITPKKKQKTSRTQLNVEVKSKIFKKVSAADVFGETSVKRSEAKLQETRQKFHKKEAAKSNAVSFNDDDEAFEAAISQMDKVADTWVDWNKIEKLKTTQGLTSRQKLSLSPSPEKTGNKHDNETDTITCVSVHGESGYESQSTASLESQDFESEPKVISGELKLKKTLDGKKQKNADNTQHSCQDRKRLSNELQTESKKQKVSDTNEVPVLFRTKKSKDFYSGKSSKTSKTSVSPVTAELSSNDTNKTLDSTSTCEIWVEKYKPQLSSKIIGQQGDKSNVKKLTAWLREWYKNNAGGKKPKFVPSGWNKDSTGASSKAALLSGPPGVGKTTTVSLVCKELGFDVVEFNASDTRSKKSLNEEVSKLLKNTSLMPYFSKEGNKKSAVTNKHVLVMDEVDGMAGNEDRGGIQELIQLIKQTKVPIICMCNDRHHTKMRSLVNYCFDLRFQRPRLEQIKGFIRSICFKEKLNISGDQLTDIITSANNDIRLILNHLSMLAAHSSNLQAASKHIKLGPWDVIQKVFSKKDHKQMTIHDKCDLFFFDYSLAPLFVQENYLSIKPLNVYKNNKQEIIELFARAADSISMGDLVDKSIREKNAWNLLPIQAIFSSYAPGEILEGYLGGPINFPSWLGKNSRQTKISRLLQEIQLHTRLKLLATKESLNLDYALPLRNQIIRPLVKHGASGAQNSLDELHAYQLLREDLDSLNEICQWENFSDSMPPNIDSKVKAAFTRLYNKNPPVRPYSLTGIVKKGASSIGDSLLDVEEEDVAVNEESSDEGIDAMIIMKKKNIVKKLRIKCSDK